jgi:hypothetical protein
VIGTALREIIRGVQLRNAHLAVVEQHKVREYLLNAAHPDNGGKAQFFELLGFTSQNPEPLVGALLAVARIGDVVEMVDSIHGEKYVVDGHVSSQTERSHRRMVRTVWIIDRGFDAPRVVTAYAGRG